jgi:putative ABC transport system substrate-binding protein
MEKLGYVEGRNLVMEERWADGHIDRLPALMTEVLERNVDVIVALGTPSAVAAMNATKKVPIVAYGIGDPVRTGLARSLAHPGGNLTGMSMGYSEEVSGKWLELLHETVPRLATVGLWLNLDYSIYRYMKSDMEAAAAKRGLKIRTLDVRHAEAIDRAFEQAHQSAQAIVLLGDAVTLENQRRIASLAAKFRIPVVYNLRTFVEEGGLMAYSTDLFAQAQRAADYVDKILKGANPADLPIEAPTHYELVVNMKAARALGLNIPESILVRADEVIR